jgi:7-carboxy-7-deazaguanine synthase
MKAKISEIFQSIQGEGQYAGVKQVFVRFFSCNMNCVWCDTKESIGNKTADFQEMSVTQVLAAIRKLQNGCRSVSLTGGEPLLQENFLKEFLPQIQKLKMLRYLDTNGILHEELQEIVKDVDVIAMDIKLPSSTQGPAYWAEHAAFLKVARRTDLFVKMVISQNTKKTDLAKAVSLITRTAPKIVVVLQPNSCDLKNGIVAKCRDYQNYCLKYLSDVRILPQMHKWMGIR